MDLYRKFRFPRHEIIALTDEVAESDEVVMREGSLPILMQLVMLALRFFACGSFQDVCGELVGVSQPTASRTIHRITQAILRTVRRWIVFPTQEQADRQKQQFWGRHRFPNTFACIDGTHILIQAPPNDEWQYINRKNFHSINVQVITFQSSDYLSPHT